MNIRARLAEYRRILKIATKPTKQELKEAIVVTGIGMLIIGFIGFLVQTIFVLVRYV